MAMDPKCKADVLSELFSSKWVLPGEVRNEFSNIDAASAASASGFLLLRRRGARRELENLRVDSGCGPDLLPTRILKACASELSLREICAAYRCYRYLAFVLAAALGMPAAQEEG